MSKIGARNECGKFRLSHAPSTSGEIRIRCFLLALHASGFAMRNQSKTVVSQVHSGIFLLLILQVENPAAEQTKLVEVPLRVSSDIEGHVVGHSFSGSQDVRI